MAHKPEPKARKKLDEAKTGSVAVAYIRVSTEQQKNEGHSLDAQRDKALAYCQVNNLQLARIYADEGISGSTAKNRSAFKQLLSDVNAGSISHVIVTKYDRLARNLRDLLDIADSMEKNGCSLVAIDNQIDTSTPNGKFFMQVFGGIAELETSMIRERVMTGKTKNAQLGGYNGAYCPLGYKYDRALHQWAITPDSQTVITIFTLWLSGETMSGIARIVADKPTRRGGKWSQSSVRYILLNGFYAGLAQWGDTEVIGNHPAIIDLEMYRAAVDKVKHTRAGNPNYVRVSN